MKTKMYQPIIGILSHLHFLQLAISMLFLNAAQFTFAQTFTITDLGTLGGTNSNAYGINNVGQVVGSSGDGTGGVQAFLWTPSSPNGTAGSLVDLVKPGFASNRAFGINNTGQVVVVSWNSNSPAWSQAFLWSPSRPNASDGSFTALPGSRARGYGINDSGAVAGFQNRCRNASCEEPVFSAVRWVNGNEIILPGGGEAIAINNAGQVVGVSASGDAVLWPTGFTMVHLVPGDAHGINSFGQVVGSSNPNQAFLWTPTTPNGTNGNLTDLGTLGGRSSAYGINSAGEIVGSSETLGGSVHAFIWRPTSLNGTRSGVRDLNTLIPSAMDWELLSAAAINCRGQIAGTGVNPSGQTHAFLLTPSPAARLTSEGIQPDGQFRFALIGAAGRSYTIQASTDLLNWTALTNFVSATGTNQFNDASAGNFQRRFYRALH